VVSHLASDFTTTGHVERLLSSASIMDTFKEYFSYGRCIPCCGISNVHFLGSQADWERVLQKTKDLAKYSTKEGPSCVGYVEGLVPILEKFIDTYKGNVDVEWWNKIFNFTHGRLGSGGCTYVSGWFLNFFYGLGSTKVDPSDIKARTLKVPVEIDNKLTGVKKDVHIVGGFGGVTKIENAYRPQMSMIVYWDGETK